MRFAFYGRVSTEDAQEPAASRAWQLREATSLSDPMGRDRRRVLRSRSVTVPPWKRRPEANRLLEDPQRCSGWEAVVIGEPSRAFYGSQFALTFPLFTHYASGCGCPRWVVPSTPGPRHMTS